MAGETLILARIDQGRDGPAYLSETLTLDALCERINLAVEAGVPLDAEVKYGYSPQHLTGGLHVVKPVDVTTLSFEKLRAMALRNNPEDSTRGWAEIERRVRTGEWAD
jgi:hypothetical protein